MKEEEGTTPQVIHNGTPAHISTINNTPSNTRNNTNTLHFTPHSNTNNNNPSDPPIVYDNTNNITIPPMGDNLPPLINTNPSTTGTLRAHASSHIHNHSSSYHIRGNNRHSLKSKTQSFFAGRFKDLLKERQFSQRATRPDSPAEVCRSLSIL